MASSQAQVKAVSGQHQDSSYFEKSGEEVKNVAQGAADIATGTARGAVCITQGVASGAANLTHGAADAVNATFGTNQHKNNNNS